MKTASIPRKFLSRREKNGHRRNRSSDPAHKQHRPLSAEAFFSIFKPESRQSASADTEREKEGAKIDDIRRRVADLDFPILSDDQIRYVLNSKYSSGDVDKAMELLLLQHVSLSGKILSYNPAVHMRGAENRGNVTCYLDALLFAMFAKLESFECMLKSDSMDEPQRKLAALLRLWVNMLRSGKLIETDMTQHIQDALAACGWRDAQLLEQQDTSEAFAFITETLQLPLLTLQVDLFHQGKNDDADHKVVYERLLNLAVPPDNNGKGIRLEDCLEEYFNSQVDVLRDSLEEKKAERFESMPYSQPLDTPDEPKSTIRVVTEEDQQEGVAPESGHGPHLERRWTIAQEPHFSDLQTDSEAEAEASGPQTILRPHRSRTESIIQRVVVDEQGKPSESDTASLFQRAKHTASIVRAVTIPAWQFFRLIPWHSPANKEPESDLEVARHFSQRPVVGICLKRYMMDMDGNMKRQNTYIDIPDSLRLPHFIVDERHVEESGLAADYKLVLQSVVCHRGDSLHSGHYVSFCRVAPKLLTDNRRHDSDPPPDYEEAQWVKFDDLAIENRVTLVDDIKESLKEEMPYLLFYQIVPIVEVAASSTESTDIEPPSYDDAALNLTNSETSATQSLERLSVSRRPSSYFDNLAPQPAANSGIRFSADLEPPRRSFADEDGFLSVSRRGSVYNDSGIPSPAAVSEGPSPAATPGEETTAQRLSRAAARFRGGNKSRPQSQAGEGRKSLSVTRFGVFIKSSKEPLRDSTSIEAEDDYEFVESIEKERIKENDADITPTPKKGKSKSHHDKGKGKDSKRTNMPDRECIGHGLLEITVGVVV
ncbi:cysteine proteinase [Daldinia grandis]|nr:cysteine proteinase [Daldinia grandis]